MDADLIWLSLRYPIIGAIVLAIIIVLVIMRVREKKKETFEKRDN